jgi:YHS domain-containing protein
MRRLHVAFTLSALLALAACDASKPMTTEQATAAATAKGIANGVCPVMGNPVDPTDPDLVVDYKGQRIGFCCGPCRPKFLKDPEKYMKVLRDDPVKYGYHAP